MRNEQWRRQIRLPPANLTTPAGGLRVGPAWRVPDVDPRGSAALPAVPMVRGSQAPAWQRLAELHLILVPDGSELTPPPKPQPDGVLVEALARASRWQKQLDRGVYSSVTEIAEAERISKSYMSRILRLALLAPDIVLAILGGWADQQAMLEKLERPLAVEWEEQRHHFMGKQGTAAASP